MTKAIMHRKKKDNRENSTLRGLLFDAGYEEILSAHNGVSDINLKAIIGDAKVLLIGDTNHAEPSITAGLAREMRDLHSAGVTTLCIELPRSKEVLNAVAELNATGSADGITDFLDRNSILGFAGPKYPYMLKAAHAAGIIIEAVDMPLEERAACGDRPEQTHARSAYMARELARVSADPACNKAAIFCGAAHLLKEGEVPSILHSLNVTFKNVFVRTEGQLSGNYMNSVLASSYIVNPLSALAPRSGIEKLVDNSERKGLDTYVDMKDWEGFNGILYLAKRSEDAAFAGAEGKHATDTESSAVLKFASAGLLNAFKVDFSNSVDPNSKSWESTNLAKLLEIMGSLPRLNTTQKLLLTVALDGYLRTTGKNGGGSILCIEYAPEENAFKIDTVDTFHHKYSPGMVRPFRREVTPGQLMARFGPPAWMLAQQAGIPSKIGALLSDSSVLKPREGNTMSMYKWMLLAMAQGVSPRPARVIGDMLFMHDLSIKILNDPRAEPGASNVHSYIASLTVRDFELNGTERALHELGERIFNTLLPLGSDIAAKFMELKEDGSQVKRRLLSRDRFGELKMLQKSNEAWESLARIDIFEKPEDAAISIADAGNEGFAIAALPAFSELRHMNEAEVNQRINFLRKIVASNMEHEKRKRELAMHYGLDELVKALDAYDAACKDLLHGINHFVAAR